MSFNISKQVSQPYDEILLRIPEELKKEGFGVLTEIDVKEVLKKKLDVDFRRYKILGACNPNFAHKALQLEDNIGVMLPCNLIVQEKDDGKVYVSAINPMETMNAVNNKALVEVASEVSAKLQRVLNSL